MEFTFDGATGQAVQTRGGVPMEQHFDNALSEERGFSLDEIERHQLDSTASNLARRAQQDHYQRGITDQDLDEGSFNYRQAELEGLLQQVQAKLYASTSPVEQARLAREAEAIATELVQGRAQESPEDFNDEESIEAAIKSELGPEVEEILNFAAENLSTESSEGINEILESGDDAEKKTAFNTLQKLKEHPEAFHTDRSEWVGLYQEQVDRLSEVVGPEVANDIHTLSHAIAQGVTSPAEVMRLASKDPALLRGLMEGTRQGIFRLMF